MPHKDYDLEISGTDKVRVFKLVKLISNYPLPQLINPVIKANDASVNTSAGKVARYAMKGSGVEEIWFDSHTHSVYAIAISEDAWSAIEFIEDIVRMLINGHFNAARKT